MVVVVVVEGSLVPLMHETGPEGHYTGKEIGLQLLSDLVDNDYNSLKREAEDTHATNRKRVLAVFGLNATLIFSLIIIIIITLSIIKTRAKTSAILVCV